MASYVWKAIGPAPQHSRFTGLVSGRVLTIAVSTDWNGSNAPALYIGLDGGGAWRSTNFTTAAPFWVPLMDSVVPAARVGAQKVLSIAVDPNRPGPNLPLTMYAAVGDPAFGILKSVDGGSSWAVLSNQFASQWPIGKIVIDPTDNSGKTLYIYGGDKGVYKSTDGGMNWSPQIVGLPTTFRVSDLDFTLDQQGRLTLYLGIGYSENDPPGVWKSIDSGDSWTRVPISLSDLGGAQVTAADVGTVLLAADHSLGTPNGVFAALTNKTTSSLMNVFTLTQNGFSDSGNGLRPINVVSGFSFAMSPEGNLYVGGVNDSRQNGLYQSVDSGTNWTSIDVGSNGLRPHTDQHSWAFFQGKAYNGNDGGIWRFTPLPNNGPGPGTWESLSTDSLQTILTQGVCLHPSDQNVCLCGSQDNSIALFTNGEWDETGGDDNSKLLFDPDPKNAGRYAYTTGVSSYQFFSRSDDGGRSWADKSPSDAKTQNASIDWFAPFAIHPVDTARLVVGIDRVYQTPDRGDSWGTAISPVFTGKQSTAIAYATNDIIWAAHDQRLFLTVNGGGNGTIQNWQEMGSGNNFGGNIIKIVVDPRFPETVYLATAEGSIWRTPDSGRTWSEITGNLKVGRVNAMALAPRKLFEDPLLFVGTSAGVYLLFNQSGTPQWGEFNLGLPYWNVADLQYSSTLSALVAGVYGRGVYLTDLKDLVLPSVKISIHKDECGTPPSLGSTIELHLTLDNGLEGQIGQIQWTVENGQPAPGENGTGVSFQVSLGSAPQQVTVSVTVTLTSGYQVSDTISFTPISARVAAWLEFVCKLIHEARANFFVDPLWDPLRDFGVHPVGVGELLVTRDKLIDLLGQVDGLIKNAPREGVG